MLSHNKIAIGALACILSTAGIGFSTSVLADDAAAFVGGVFAAKLMSNVRAQTEAEQVQAAAAVQQSQSSSSKSTEQRLQELDSLAAKGYITQDEYKAKRKAILDGM